MESGSSRRSKRGISPNDTDAQGFEPVLGKGQKPKAQLEALELHVSEETPFPVDATIARMG